MTDTRKTIIVFGNPVDGFRFEGPFEDADEAQDYVEATDQDEGDWWFASLTLGESPEREEPASGIPVVVLNDGETYSHLTGSRILVIPDGVAGEDADQYVKDNYGKAAQVR